MLISAIVPTYNRSGMLTRAVASVLNQSYQPVEVVIIDDGSTDDTRETLERTYPGEERIRYFFQQNAGCAAARNAGLAAMRGEAFAFLDSDDEWGRDAILNLARALSAAEADFVYSPAVEITKSGKEWINLPVAAGEPRQLARKHFMQPNVRNGSVLFSRKVLEKVPGLDGSLRHNEDSDFLQKIAINYVAAYCPEPTVRVHHHGQNKSANRPRIYRSLLHSTEAILAQYPAFSESIGSAAEQRIRQLRRQHVESLIAAEQMDQARRQIESYGLGATLAMRLSLALGTAVPLKLHMRLRRLFGAD